MLRKLARGSFIADAAAALSLALGFSIDACRSTCVITRHDHRRLTGSTLAGGAGGIPSMAPRYHGWKGTPAYAVRSNGLRYCSQNWRCPAQNCPSRYRRNDR
ncbi:MAG: hypothetical protein IPF47_10095 [Gemmatimonadetes bacterium]|nr:hypothetical protein [Gemmatimonadota bacterium]